MEHINMESLAEKQLTTYQNNDMAILRSFKEIQNSTTDNLLLLNNFIFVAVTKGNAQVFVDEQVCNLEVGDVFLCTPNRLLKKSMFSLDFDIIALVFNMNFVDIIVKELNMGLEYQRFLVPFNIIPCLENELKHMVMYCDFIQDKLNQPDSINKKRSIAMLCCSMVYELIDAKNRTVEPVKCSSFSSGENILERFLNMLHDSSQPFLNVNGYAHKLNISAKYFSTLCKKHTGKTARQIIQEEIIHQAQILLKDSRYSIQQIATTLGFANQSHFGVFFHRYTGISPQKYRIGDF